MNKQISKKAGALVLTFILTSITLIPVVNSQFEPLFINYQEPKNIKNNFLSFTKNFLKKANVNFGNENWWDKSWPYRKLITVDHNQVAANLTNFPVLIELSNDSDLADHSQDDGDDIAFILYSDNTTQFNHEIEFFNSSNGNLIAWVNVTSLSSTVDTKIWMYYGNSASGNQENVDGTWDSHYIMVQHMNESSGTLFDSTSNDNDGINDNATFNSSAKIDGAYNFDGEDNNIDVGTFDIDGSGLTLSLWFNADSFAETTLCTSGLRLISKATGPETSAHYWMIAPADEGEKFRYRLKTEDFVTSNLIVDTGGMSTSTWYYVVATYDGSYMRVFNDGIELGNKTKSGAVATDNNVSVWIGSNPPNDYRPFDGVIDEVRVSNVARNSSWILTSYNNQNNSDDFTTLSEEELCQYTLKININGNGTVTKEPNQETYTYGTLVNVTAVADVGWSFSHWTGDLTGSNNPETIKMTSDKNITAHFTQDQYTLTINIDGNGTVTKDPNQTTYIYGTLVNLTAVADPGWTFDHWSGDLNGSNNPEIINMTSDKNVTTHFTEDRYTLTISINGNGTVAKDPNQENYTYGTLVELTAVPDSGWNFSHWSGDLSGSENPATINMTSNKTVTAHFTESEYTLKIDIIGSGSVKKEPDQNTYLPGTIVTLTATADSGWMFSHWIGDLSGSENPIQITMTSNKKVTAHFEQDSINPSVKIVKPENAIYVIDREIIPFKFPVVFVGVTVEVDALDNESGIERVEFYINGELKSTDTNAPYEWIWKDSSVRMQTITVFVYDYAGNSDSQEISVWKWKYHPVLIAIFILFALVYILIGG